MLDPFCGSGTALVAAKLLHRTAVGIDVSKEAVDLTRRRLAEPVKTESNLLKNGLDSYRTANGDALSLLNGISHTPVQRNNGIDAFLTETYKGVPIPVRMQRHGETVVEAACALRKSAKTKRAQRMILIAIEDQPSLLEMEIPDEVLVVTSAALAISRTLQGMQDERRTFDKPDAGNGKQPPHPRS